MLVAYVSSFVYSSKCLYDTRNEALHITSHFPNQKFIQLYPAVDYAARGAWPLEFEKTTPSRVVV